MADMHDEVVKEPTGDYKIHSGQLTANTGLSLGLLVAMLGVFWTLMQLSNQMATWQAKVDFRLESLESRVSSRPDPWSGTMMQAYDNELGRILSRTVPDIATPDVRRIQKAGAELEWRQNR